VCEAHQELSVAALAQAQAQLRMVINGRMQVCVRCGCMEPFRLLSEEACFRASSQKCVFTDRTCDGSGLSIGIYDEDDDNPEIVFGYAKVAVMDIAAASMLTVEGLTRHSGMSTFKKRARSLEVVALRKFGALDLDSGWIVPATQKSNEGNNVSMSAQRDSQSDVSPFTKAVPLSVRGAGASAAGARALAGIAPAVLSSSREGAALGRARRHRHR